MSIESVYCDACGRACDPVNDADWPVTRCSDCATPPSTEEVRPTENPEGEKHKPEGTSVARGADATPPSAPASEPKTIDLMQVLTADLRKRAADHPERANGTDQSRLHP